MRPVDLKKTGKHPVGFRTNQVTEWSPGDLSRTKLEFAATEPGPLRKPTASNRRIHLECLHIEGITQFQYRRPCVRTHHPQRHIHMTRSSIITIQELGVEVHPTARLGFEDGDIRSSLPA